MRRAFFAVLVALIPMLGTLKPATAQTVGDYSIPALTSRALEGNARAQLFLGSAYANGGGVPQNHAEAAKWYRLAADQGEVHAQLFLGSAYDNGRGVPQNDAEAVKWYRLAADQGLPGAQNALGTMYAYGLGVPQNDVLAHMWFNLASARRISDAQKDRDRLASKMPPAQIAEAQRLAAQWKPKGRP